MIRPGVAAPPGTLAGLRLQRPAQIMAQPSPGDTLRQIQESPGRRRRLRDNVERYLDLPSALTAALMLVLIGAQFDARVRRHGQ
jgi:hypothetical protein